MRRQRCMLFLIAGVWEQVGHAAPREGDPPYGGEGSQVCQVFQVIPIIAAARAALACPHERAKVPMPLLWQSLQAAFACPAASTYSYRYAVDVSFGIVVWIIKL